MPNIAISVYVAISEVASERFCHQRNHQRNSETSSGQGTRGAAPLVQRQILCISLIAKSCRSSPYK